VLPCMECWATPREEFLKLFLVKVDDQVFDGNGFSILTVACDSISLLRKKTFVPSGAAILFFIENLSGKTYKILRREITSNS